MLSEPAVGSISAQDRSRRALGLGHQNLILWSAWELFVGHECITAVGGVGRFEKIRRCLEIPAKS
jgi:hypothetical protein